MGSPVLRSVKHAEQTSLLSGKDVKIVALHWQWILFHWIKKILKKEEIQQTNKQTNKQTNILLCSADTCDFDSKSHININRNHFPCVAFYHFPHERSKLDFEYFGEFSN